MRDFDRVCDFGSLYKAHLKACKGKRHKRDVMSFEMNLAYHLSELQEQLINETYEMSGYRHFYVHEPKLRDIYEVAHVDKVLMHVLCDEVLIPRLSPHFIYDNAACQVGKGTHFAMDRFSKFLREQMKVRGRDFYVLKCDISKYFASINHVVLKEKLARKIADPNVLKLINGLIDSYHTNDRPRFGIPLGNQTSQWFALFYMSDFDHFVKERLGVRGYIRYMDDFVLIHDDPKFLWSALAEIERFLSVGLNLRLNPKTAVIKVSRGVEFLGWRFVVAANGRVIRRVKVQSKARIRKGLRRIGRGYAHGNLKFNDVCQRVCSYEGHLRHGNAHYLSQKLMSEVSLEFMD